MVFVSRDYEENDTAITKKFSA